jgi:NTE family protein
LLEYIKQILKPILYQADFVERLKRDVLLETLGYLKAPYKNTERKEQGYQKLRSQYPLRTVELRVGDIKTTDFNQATRFARVMDSLGFLDTVNHITMHEPKKIS